MHKIPQLKQLIYVGAFLFVFFFITSVSYAIPGQLIYGINGNTSSACEDALAACKKEAENSDSLSKKYQLQIVQDQKTNKELTRNLAQKNKEVVILEIAFGVVIILSAAGFIFLKKYYHPKQ